MPLGSPQKALRKPFSICQEGLPTNRHGSASKFAYVVQVSSGLFDIIYTVCTVNEGTERKTSGSPPQSFREGFLYLEICYQRWGRLLLIGRGGLPYVTFLTVHAVCWKICVKTQTYIEICRSYKAVLVLEVGLILINYNMKLERNCKGAGRKFFLASPWLHFFLYSNLKVNIL